MSFRIDDLKAEISGHGGMSHPNRFNVFVQPPAAVGVGNLRHMSLMCTSTSMPGRTLATSEYQTVHKLVKIPYTYLNSDLSLTFYLTNDMFSKQLFEKWQAYIIDYSKYRMRYFDEYVGEMRIQQLSKDNKVTYTAVVKDCYPVDVGPIELDNSQENAIQTFTVQMAYRDFHGEV